MYSRKIEDCPEKFVHNGKIVFGTFKGHPKRLDIRGVAGPYGVVPLPTFITNLRIKSRLSFFFSVGEYIGNIEFFDAKVFGMAEICFWNMTTKQRFVYRSVMGPRKRFVPHRLEFASTASYKKSRYIRISWDRSRNKLSVIFNLKGDSVRPVANAALLANFDSEDFAELTSVVPAPTLRRCSAVYNAMLPLHGAISLLGKDGSQKTMDDKDGVCFFDMNRSYMKFRSFGEFVTGLGSVNGKNISFRIKSTSQDAALPDKYNENVLFYDGKATPLPPVVITHPYGIMNQWVIQDTENMIDLTFTPISENLNKISVLVLRTVYHTIYGTFEGMVRTADGEKINIKSLAGLSEKYTIRL